MKPLRDIEEIIRTKLHAGADAALHDRMLERVREARAQNDKTTPAPCEPVLRRSIMKSPITKVAVAAAVIMAIALGLALFIDTGATSGVAWGEVAQRVAASPGAIWRVRGTGSRDANDDWPNGYEIIWRSAAITRTDKYRDNQTYRTVYYNLDTAQTVLLAHDAKKHLVETMSDEQVQRARADTDRWTSPQALVERCLALEHHTLDQKTIEGVLCEGIETTDTSGLPLKSFTARLWVAVETGYPVLVEIAATDDGDVRHTTTLDQFQWNVDLAAEDVEPQIPADYEPL